MNMDKYTQNAQAVVAESQGIAAEFGQQQVDGEHLHLALLRQEDSEEKQIGLLDEEMN